MVASYQGKLHEQEREHYPHVQEFMSRSMVKLSPDTDIYEAIGLLLKFNISGAPVVDDENNLVGIVSEKDCLKLVAQDTYQSTPQGGPIGNFMTTEVVTVSPGKGLSEVAQIFMKTPFKKLPVIQRGKLVGMIRRRDVLAVIQEFHRKRMLFMKQHS